MPAAMRCSRWSALPARTISMRPICRIRPRLDRQVPANGAGNGFAAASGAGAAQLNKTHPTRPGNGYDGRGRRSHRSAPPVILAPEQSAELRDRLLGELAAISSAEQADGLGAHRPPGEEHPPRSPMPRWWRQAFERAGRAHRSGRDRASSAGRAGAARGEPDGQGGLRPKAAGQPQMAGERSAEPRQRV